MNVGECDGGFIYIPRYNGRLRKMSMTALHKITRSSFERRGLHIITPIYFAVVSQPSPSREHVRTLAWTLMVCPSFSYSWQRHQDPQRGHLANAIARLIWTFTNHCMVMRMNCAAPDKRKPGGDARAPRNITRSAVLTHDRCLEPPPSRTGVVLMLAWMW